MKKMGWLADTGADLGQPTGRLMQKAVDAKRSEAARPNTRFYLCPIYRTALLIATYAS